MTQRLSQVIAIERGTKGTTASELTTLHRAAERPQLYAGLSRTYRPRNDDDPIRLAGEEQLVQLRASQVLGELRKTLSKLFNLTATKDEANTHARANVEVDGVTVLENVPATTLLFLEKELHDVRTFLAKLPTLDPAETWEFDEAIDAYRTATVVTNKTTKLPRNHVKAEATDKHPAQVEVWWEDDVTGFWDTVKFSGALPAQRVRTLVERVIRLQDAVKSAREEANRVDAEPVEIAAPLFDYLLS